MHSVCYSLCFHQRGGTTLASTRTYAAITGLAFWLSGFLAIFPVHQLNTMGASFRLKSHFARDLWLKVSFFRTRTSPWITILMETKILQISSHTSHLKQQSEYTRPKEYTRHYIQLLPPLRTHITYHQTFQIHVRPAKAARIPARRPKFPCMMVL